MPEVIMLTGQATVESAIEAMKLGAYDYLTKALPHHRTRRVLVTQSAEKQKLKIDNQRLRAQLERTRIRRCRKSSPNQPQMKEDFKIGTARRNFRYIGFDYGRIGNGQGT